MTITTPAGVKVRSQSNRRFIVISEFSHRTDESVEPTARIDRRSDSLPTARQFVSSKGGTAEFFTDGRMQRRMIFDTVAGEFV